MSRESLPPRQLNPDHSGEGHCGVSLHALAHFVTRSLEKLGSVTLPFDFDLFLFLNYSLGVGFLEIAFISSECDLVPTCRR
jgi:hypothetical protein